MTQYFDQSIKIVFYHEIVCTLDSSEKHLLFGLFDLGIFVFIVRPSRTTDDTFMATTIEWYMGKVMQ